MAQPFVRRDIWSLSVDDPTVTAYADAVAAMKAKPDRDPTSWAYQAAIHGSHAQRQRPAWNQCRHGGWYFLSWHRMYLYYFERIVRAQVVANGGPDDWALPYWNYDAGGRSNRLPRAFRGPLRADGSENPLYVARRARGVNRGAGLPGSITSAAFALGRTAFTGVGEFGGGRTSPLGQFWSETGRLEQTPHNDVHVAVGGLMGDPDTAAQDPIFWLHHANIDRLWRAWQADHANPQATTWRQQTFDFFDVGGVPVTLSADRVMRTQQQLGYIYEEPRPTDAAPSTAPGPAVAGVASFAALPPEPGPQSREDQVNVRWPGEWPSRPGDGPRPAEDTAPTRELVGATEQPVELEGTTRRVPVTIDRRTVGSLSRRMPAPQQRAYLDVEDIEAPRNPGVVYGVYINLPEDPTPEDLARHHVGNVSLFGVERARDPRGDVHAHGLRISMEITDVLDRLAESGEWQDGDRIEATFRPVSLEPPDEEDLEEAGDEPDDDDEPAAEAPPPVRVGRISVHFA